ncbi:hypothetical protein Pelo_5070 [Pelomyxa schiedti]|nr:hypothetical protein Pelo_5070 [Pelomyxa schiedti]
MATAWPSGDGAFHVQYPGSKTRAKFSGILAAWLYQCCVTAQGLVHLYRRRRSIVLGLSLLIYSACSRVRTVALDIRATWKLQC